MPITRTTASDVEGAAAAILEHGIVILDGVIPPQEAASLVPPILAHPTKRTQPIGFYHAPCMFNIEPRYMGLAAHPALVQIARLVIGGREEPLPNAHAIPVDEQIHVNDANGVVVLPGNGNGYWHCDGPIGQLHPDRLPEFPMTLTVMWMLTEFSQHHGGTRAMPGSNQWRRMPPSDQQGPLNGDACVEGMPGSVAIFGNTTWHTLGRNSSSTPRVGLQCTLYPWFMGRSGHVQAPITREVWDSLPAAVPQAPLAQACTRHMLDWSLEPPPVSFVAGDGRTQALPAATAAGGARL